MSEREYCLHMAQAHLYKAMAFEQQRLAYELDGNAEMTRQAAQMATEQRREVMEWQRMAEGAVTRELPLLLIASLDPHKLFTPGDTLATVIAVAQEAVGATPEGRTDG